MDSGSIPVIMLVATDSVPQIVNLENKNMYVLLGVVFVVVCVCVCVDEL